MKLTEVLALVTNELRQAGVPSPEIDSKLLLAHFLDCSLKDLELKLLMAEELSEKDLNSFQALVDKRKQRIPLQHITGRAYFRYLELEVGNGVFIPRPETESVVQLGLDFISTIETPRVLDIGTGSGAIAISIATEHPTPEVVAVEKSPVAFQFAQRNISKNKASVELLLGDFEELELPEQSFDLVISNPPYIPLGAVPRDPEVRDHDPKLALYSGEDGLDAIRAISTLGLRLLKPKGGLILEHADSQSESVCELLWSRGWKQVSAHQDATGRYRTVSAVK
jgi:release factor glutamine methyltransferase